jgi:hypothetical protein
MLARHLGAYLNGTPPPIPEQRVEEPVGQMVSDIVDQILILDIQKVSDAPPTMIPNNPTLK